MGLRLGDWIRLRRAEVGAERGAALRSLAVPEAEAVGPLFVLPFEARGGPFESQGEPAEGVHGVAPFVPQGEPFVPQGELVFDPGDRTMLASPPVMASALDPPGPADRRGARATPRPRLRR